MKLSEGVLLCLSTLAICMANVHKPRHRAVKRMLKERDSKYSAIISIGASYQDNGHPRPEQYQFSLQPPPYVGGRKTNGPVMVESLYTLSGAEYLYDYAYIGAQINNSLTGGSVPDSGAQITAYSNALDNGLTRGPDRKLHVLWHGINNVLYEWYGYQDSLDLDGALKDLDKSIDSLADQIIRLQEIKTHQRLNDFLILPIPPLEIVPNPWFYVDGDEAKLAFLGEITEYYNNRLDEIITDARALGQAYDQDIYTYDIVGLWRDVDAHPEKYGLVESKVACYNSSTGGLCSEPDGYMYFDTLHPTTAFFAKVARHIWESGIGN